MQFSIRVVNTAAHFGTCLSEEVNPFIPSATVLDWGSVCTDSRTGIAKRGAFPLAFEPRFKFDQCALLTRRCTNKVPCRASNPNFDPLIEP